MPENEIAIPYTVVLKLVSETANKSRVKQLQADIDRDATGVLFAYRKGNVAFDIRRYRTGRFIKRSY